jgi:F-box protein 16
MNRSKIKQLKFVQDIVNEKVPCIREDFTRELPKVLSIYIFSFLDPRSLSRCARVSQQGFLKKKQVIHNCHVHF